MTSKHTTEPPTEGGQSEKEETGEGEPSHDASAASESSDDEQGDEEEYEKAPEDLEDGGQPTIDELEEINLGTPEDPRLLSQRLYQMKRRLLSSNYSKNSGMSLPGRTLRCQG